jgi:hypothetical protein
MANLHSVKKARLPKLKHAHGDAVYVHDTKELFVSVGGELVLLTEFFRRWPDGPTAPWSEAVNTDFLKRHPKVAEAITAIHRRNNNVRIS